MVIAHVIYARVGSACTPLVMGGTRAGGRARGVYPRVYPPLWIVFSRGSTPRRAAPRGVARHKRLSARGARAVGRRRKTRAIDRRGFF